jgi:hypothetical protein
MLKGFTLGLAAYSASAVVFLTFSVLFVRTYGSSSYGSFSILLNTVSAVTLFGNYHGAIISFSAASERTAFRRMLLPVITYASVAGLISGVVLSVMGSLDYTFFALVSFSLFLVIASGLPTASLLASSENWKVNVFRAIYQVVLVVVFWLLYAATRDVGASFSISLFAAAASYFILLAWNVSLPAETMEIEPIPRGLLPISVFSNLMLMGTMLTDKIVIRYIGLKSSPDDIGVFFLYYDLVARVSAVYAIALAPFTYEILSLIRSGKTVLKPILAAGVICLCTGLLAVPIGYSLVPAFYSIDLTGREWLPAVMCAYLVLLGCSAILMAYCNASGQIGFLSRHYVGVLLTGIGAIAVFYAMSGNRLSIAHLALALTTGQIVTLFSGVILLSRIPPPQGR